MIGWRGGAWRISFSMRGGHARACEELFLKTRSELLNIIQCPSAQQSYFTYRESKIVSRNSKPWASQQTVVKANKLLRADPVCPADINHIWQSFNNPLEYGKAAFYCRLFLGHLLCNFGLLLCYFTVGFAKNLIHSKNAFLSWYLEQLVARKLTWLAETLSFKYYNKKMASKFVGCLLYCRLIETNKYLITFSDKVCNVVHCDCTQQKDINPLCWIVLKEVLLNT